MKGKPQSDFKKLLYTLAILLSSFGFFSQTAKPKDRKDFPKPKDIKNLLFYVQRTFNTNTLIYSLNMNGNNEIDEKEPVKIYWVNYSKDGKTEGLNFIQRKYAYGIDIKMIDTLKKSYCFNFVSYKKKPIYLIKSAVDNKYEAFSTFNNRLIILTRIFVQIEGGSFWTPKVKFIEITGRDPVKNEEVVEIVIP